MYTTQGLMTSADLADYEVLTDPECEGHDDPDAWLGVAYCSRAEICPGEDLEPL